MTSMREEDSKWSGVKLSTVRGKMCVRRKKRTSIEFSFPQTVIRVRTYSEGLCIESDFSNFHFFSITFLVFIGPLRVSWVFFYSCVTIHPQSIILWPGGDAMWLGCERKQFIGLECVISGKLFVKCWKNIKVTDG